MHLISTFVILSSLIALFGTAQGQTRVAAVDVPPKDTVVEAGKDAMLLCETTIDDHDVDSLEWKEHISSNSGSTIFRSHIPDTVENPEKYEIHGEFNLKVTNTAVEDGGLYSCKLFAGEHSANEADLIVIEQPEIILPDMIVENDTRVVGCKTMYGARDVELLSETEVPKMSISIGHRIIAVQAALEPGQPGNPSEGAYKPSVLQVYFNLTAEWKYNNRDITCAVFTTDPIFRTNSSQTLNIEYPVRKIQIHPQKETYEVGEVIECYADGNPAPDYKWTPINTETSANTDAGKLNVTWDMIGLEQVWLCTASNTVLNIESISTEITFNAVEPSEATGGDNGAPTLAPAIFTLLAFFSTYILQ